MRCTVTYFVIRCRKCENITVLYDRWVKSEGTVQNASLRRNCLCDVLFRVSAGGVMKGHFHGHHAVTFVFFVIFLSTPATIGRGDRNIST